MSVKIDTVSAREKLKPRREPYWHRLAQFKYLGYRKMTPGLAGTWLVRIQSDDGKKTSKSLGAFLDIPDHQRFDAANKAARDLVAHVEKGGSTEDIDVAEACRRLVKKYRDEGRESAANDAEGRFRRWVYNDKKLARIPLLKLTPAALSDWRTQLAKTPPLHQDKKKKTERPRSGSTLNRDMAALKTALNLALEDGLVTSDYAWSAKLKPVPDATRRRECYLDAGQRRALINKAPDELAPLIHAMCLLPLRPGAVAALTVGNFDKRLGVLTVGKDKTGKDRKITLPDATANFFAHHTKDKLPGARLFARKDGVAWDKDSWKGPFKEAVIAADLPKAATAYALRHSTITDLIALHRLDIMTVAMLSGTSISMIEKHYGHLLHARAATGLAALAI